MNVSVSEHCVQIPDVRPGEAVKTKLTRVKASLREKALLLPRPLDNVSRPRLCAYWLWSVFTVAGASYGVVSGKSLSFGLKDRRLDASGHAISFFMLGLGFMISILSSHELWVRETKQY